jgi:hypothetical protein
MGFAQNLITCLVCTNGRLAIAGAFIAGKRGFAKKSAKRTAERVDIWHLRSTVPLHGLHFHGPYPCSELLGYCQSSARADWSKYFLCKAVLMESP